MRTSKENVNLVPLLNLELKWIDPPNFWTSCLEITRPIPIPSVLIFFALSFIDPNNLKIFPWSSFFIPMPSSLTEIFNYLNLSLLSFSFVV